MTGLEQGSNVCQLMKPFWLVLLALVPLVACDSTRALVATPTWTLAPLNAWVRPPVGPVPGVSPGRTTFEVYLSRTLIENGLPASASLALLIDGVPAPLFTAQVLPASLASESTGSLLTTSAISGGSLFAGPGGKATYTVVVDQRAVRLFDASISVVP